MALKINFNMTSQQPSKSSHTKVLDVFRSKSHKKNSKDPRQGLFFKIRPEKAVSQLIIPYKDLRDNFPYALIEYYETKLKIKNQNSADFESFVSQNNNKPTRLRSAKNEQPKNKGHQKKQSMAQMEQKIVVEQNQNQAQKEKIELIFDFDSYSSSEQYRPVFKSIAVLFSESEPNQNRYLKDLKDLNSQSSISSRKIPTYQYKRKKVRIDYTQ